ncbi:tyrosine-protein kinase hopscotch [Aplysia californica]|uniref:Tyrosine-protein kinase hopscotch n=1 Tax=Aplysia californica TaxID=6500 RepID=A0ABM0K1T5_APLCA|nr:tyrosine-protein kinase hopscotch [Aplysia californica]
MPNNTTSLVTVHFVKGIPPKTIDTSEYEYSLKTLRQECLEYVHEKVSTDAFEGSLIAAAFGLVTLPEEEIWLPPWHVFSRSAKKHMHYKFRVRHRPPVACYSTDNFLGRYLFLQIREDFHTGRLGENKNLTDSSVMALLSMSLYLPHRLPFDDFCIVDNNYISQGPSVFNMNNKLSKSIRDRFLSVPILDKVLLKSSLKKEFEKHKMRGNPMSEYMKKLYEVLVKALPEYCFEKYEVSREAQDGKKNVTVHLRLYADEIHDQPGLYYGTNFKCTLLDIDSIELKLPDSEITPEWEVCIILRNKEVKKLIFTSKESAESFISGVEGYVQLCQRYDICLFMPCRMTHQYRVCSELHIFGPLRESTIKAILGPKEEDDSPIQSQQFLICQSSVKLNSFQVKIVQPRNNESNTVDEKELEIRYEDGGRLSLWDGETELSQFGNSLELRIYLKRNFRKQILPNKDAPVVAEINSWYKSESLDYYISTDDNTRDSDEDKDKAEGTSVFVEEDIKLVAEIPDRNPFVFKDKVQVQVRSGADMKFLTRVQVNSANTDVLRGFSEGLVRCHKLHQVSRKNFVGLCGMILNTSSSSVLVEHAPSGDLLTYLREGVKLRIKVNIMEQIVHVLQVMVGKSLFHGNIRCRRFVVFDCADSEFVHIKLGDPGVSSYLDKLPVNSEFNVERYPWLAPERRCEDGISELTYESECFAVGTTFYEILCRNDDFSKQLEPPSIDNPEAVYNLLNQGENTELPKPAFLRESEAIKPDSPSPDSKEAMEQIWQLIRECWSHDPNDRPNTTTLITRLFEIREDVGVIKNETQNEVLIKLLYDAGDHNVKESSRISQDHVRQFVNRNKEMMISHNLVHRIGPKPLGEGNYGTVWEGTVELPHECLNQLPERRKVAIKDVKNFTSLKNGSFLKEVIVATELHHPNIVKVLYCSYNPRGLQSDINTLIMEFMNQGTLREFAQTKKQPLTTLLKLIDDVIQGMIFLSGKNIVHRDLAARNILLCYDEESTSHIKLTAKISDFGLSRVMERNTQVYSLKKGELLPYFWMPPELLEFSTRGDVWSFGVVMWETFTGGKHPSQAVSESNQSSDAYHALLTSGWRLPQKIGRVEIDPDIYSVMKDHCWQLNPEKRLFFVELPAKIQTIQAKFIQAQLPCLA